MSTTCGCGQNEGAKNLGKLPKLETSRAPITREEIRSAKLPSLKNRAVIGIGTSNKKIEDFIAELKSEGVTTVVDVRARPQSRFCPWFNRKALEVSLGAAKIKYVLMGEYFGNPKNAEGLRTLEGFVRHKNLSEKYKEGLKELAKLAHSSRGSIALMCAERREEECHRKYIIADIGRVLGRK